MFQSNLTSLVVVDCIVRLGSCTLDTSVSVLLVMFLAVCRRPLFGLSKVSRRFERGVNHCGWWWRRRWSSGHVYFLSLFPLGIVESYRI